MACENESYDSGTGNYSLIQADFVEAHSNNGCAVDYVITDDNDSLAIVPQQTANWITRPDTAYRAILYYEKMGDNQAEPMSISQVPTLTITPVKSFKEVNTYPVKFESIWISKNKKYINLGFYLKVGEINKDESLHTIGMMRDTVITNDDGSHTSYLRLYHDQGDVPEYYSAKYYVSFPCSTLDGDSVCISINTYNGMVTRKLKLPK